MRKSTPRIDLYVAVSLACLYNGSQIDVCICIFVYLLVCFLLGDSPASDLYMPTFRNTLSVPSSKAGVK